MLRRPRTLPIPRWISPRHYTITLSECLGHSSFLLVFISYAVDDFMMLRYIAVAGSTAMLFFTYYHPHGRILWLPFQWNVAFIAVNLYRIGRVHFDKYQAKQLSPELLRLHDRSFYLMSPVDFYKLMRIATIRDYKKGQLIVRQGEGNRYVRLVLSDDGQLSVLRDGQLTYILEHANFISESGLHAGLMLAGDVESCCTIVTDTPVRLVEFERTELIKLLRRDPGVRRALKATISWDIVRKLKKQRALLSTHMIGDPDKWTAKRSEQTQHRYAAILHNMLSNPKNLAERRKELDKYRMIHNIDDNTHELALREVGWTVDEFRVGHREGESHYAQETPEDWFSHLKDFYMRLFA